MAVFFATLDIGGINVIVLYRLNKDEEVMKHTYLRNLARSVVMEHAQRCLTIDQTPFEIKCQIPEVFGVDAPDREKEYSPGLCYLCSTTRNRMTTTQCIRCECYISLFQKNNVTTAKIIIFQNEHLKFSRHEKWL